MVLLLLICIVFLGIPATAHGFELGIQDQGADPQTLNATANQLGATTTRLIVRPGQPLLEQIRVARVAGRRVQVAIQLKRWSTPGDVRDLLQVWNGQVKTVSIGNEPELNGLAPCVYARLYRRIYALIRREFPGIRIGFGEFSPTDPIGYTRKVLECGSSFRARSERELQRWWRAHQLRADFWAVHPYQFHSDPFGPPVTERAMGAGLPSWMGLGNLGSAHRFLRTNRKNLQTPRGATLPIRATEFAYLLTGGYATTTEKATWMWPRAIKQARRWTEQLIVYGLGPVRPDSGWGSASLLDDQGFALPALDALTRALGRRNTIGRRPLGPVTFDPPAQVPEAPFVVDDRGRNEDHGHGVDDTDVTNPDPEVSAPDVQVPAPEPTPADSGLTVSDETDSVAGHG